ncbi:MAG TPA: hypothetical protein DCG75_17590 [Bacteroidales bacterium]|nr:hypothetical protein [Bacteroidales bacterium]
MKKIFLLTDYKNHFGSKHLAFPYRSGFDKTKLENYFSEFGFSVKFMNFTDLDFRKQNFNNEIILYTSQEDVGYFYKDFIEDIVGILEQNGAKNIPSFCFLRANNNKVYMELLRDQLNSNKFKTIKSLYFGSIEELKNKTEIIDFPVVLKSAAGASGRGVSLAKNKNELIKQAKKISNTRNIKKELWEIGRTWKHKGYIKESKNRLKFIVQNFIPDLKNDWKVYVFGEKYFIFYRPIFKHRGFRASGGGYNNYFYGGDAKIPEGIFDFAKELFNELKVPNLSIDIAFDGTKFHLVEFQGIYFGTAGILHKHSKEYFMHVSNEWKPFDNTGEIEKVYVESIVKFIKNNN